MHRNALYSGQSAAAEGIAEFYIQQCVFLKLHVIYAETLLFMHILMTLKEQAGDVWRLHDTLEAPAKQNPWGNPTLENAYSSSNSDGLIANSLAILIATFFSAASKLPSEAAIAIIIRISRREAAALDFILPNAW